MYSKEIEELLRVRNYLIDSELYFNVFNVRETPQISYVECVDKQNTIKVCTYDNYQFNFKVYRKEK